MIPVARRERRAAIPRTLLATLATGAATLALAAGCVADPPPAAVVGQDDAVGPTVNPQGGLSLAVDRLSEGLNPHLVADQGPDTDLFSELTLPSAFHTSRDGRLALNTLLLDSADVLTQTPFTVRYAIKPAAQWSDSVPVGAEDFAYLWRQMRTQPGVVDPVGYDHVTAVRAGAGGKIVDVVFDAPFEGWRSLFSRLVPAHLLKDSPGGFQSGLARGSTASAGPYMVRRIDLGRGVVEFVRNDRYWDTPPILDQIVVRRVSGPGPLGQALRSSPAALAAVADSPVNHAVVATVPGFSSSRAESTAQLELGFDTTGPFGGEVAVRKAVTAAVDAATVGQIITGSSDPRSTAFPFPEGTGSAPAGDRLAVPMILRDAGFVQVGDRWMRGGVPLSVTIGVASGDPDTVTAAYTVSDQLHAVGIGAKVWELDQVALYADAIPHGLVDAVVSRQRTDGDPVIAARSRYSCQSRSAEGQAPAGTPLSRTAEVLTSLSPPPPDAGSAATSTTTPASGTPTRRGVSDLPARATDIGGLCDPTLDAALAAAVHAVDPGDALRRAGLRVGELALRLPLVRPRILFGQSPAVDGVPAPSDAESTRYTSDLYSTAPTWRRR